MPDKITSIVDVPPRDPRAAAAYYRYRRESGTWVPDEMQALLMLQGTPERGRELTALLREVERDLKSRSP